SGEDDSAVVVGQSERHRRKQLRIAAIAGYVEDVDRRIAAAIRSVHGAEHSAPFVDLERLPGIEHRRCCEVRRVVRLRRIADVEGAYAEIRAWDSRCRWKGRMRGSV